MNEIVQPVNIVLISIIVGFCLWVLLKRWDVYGKGTFIVLLAYVSTLIPTALLRMFDIITIEQNRSISFVLRIIVIIALFNVYIRGKK